MVRAAGVRFLEVCDPYDSAGFETLLRQADAHIRSPEGGVAVLISRHPCLMDRKATLTQQRFAVSVHEDCVGCRRCVEQFECPALLMDEATGRAAIDAGPLRRLRDLHPCLSG